ncbi:uncharacterized protein [Argopecten irradians]|uniref:uncharacterized protein isoform X2 n=1 Tax=Argopecten irradians TaxID=31199 RepID=UPI0037226179
MLLFFPVRLVQMRILLSDPQFIQQELTRFQSELQEIQVKYNTQNTELSDLKAKYDIQNTKLAELQVKYDAQGAKGAVITRWGRNDCPANITTKVYSGTAGGSYFYHTGAAADYVCMPDNPIWGPHKDVLITGESVGYMYGAEYEEPNTLFGMPNDAEDVPCAVCLITQYAVSLMIPGRTECYPGWTEVYHGDLAAGYHGHPAASQYVCVDGNPQAIPRGGNHDENGKLFYGVKSKCGSLPCPPYEDGKFLSCVVCMK